MQSQKSASVMLSWTLLAVVVSGACGSSNGKFLGATHKDVETLRDSDNKSRALSTDAVNLDNETLHEYNNKSRALWTSALTVENLPTFSSCQEARFALMYLPKHLRWEYDCARICHWPCAGGRNCNCECSKWANDAEIRAGGQGFAFPQHEGPECFALRPAHVTLATTTSTTTTTTTTLPAEHFEVSIDEVVGVLGLSAEVHDFAQLEEHHLQGFEERLVMADFHYSESLGNGSDHSRVYTRGCSVTPSGDEFCDDCAIAFTATTDTWDFEEDLNINLIPFCGLSQVHAGFASEMRSYMDHPQWEEAVSMMTTQRCRRAYAVGTSLGGAIASLFAFCANQATVTNDADKAKFTGQLDIIPITFGAPAVAKEQVYNGQPGQCFRGARVAISQPDISELNAAQTISGIEIIKGFLEIQSGSTHEDLESALTGLRNATEDADLFATLRAQLFESVMPSIVLEMKDILMSVLVPSSGEDSADASGGINIMDFAVPLLQLLPLATSQTFPDILPALPPPLGPGLPIQLSPSEAFAFEYDVTPGLLSGFNFQHAMVPYYRVAHPEGQAPAHIFEVGACSASAHLPEADFLKVFYATLGSFLTPTLAQSGSGNFPNHHLCCYFRGLTGAPRGSCGVNEADGQSFSCDEPSWR